MASSDEFGQQLHALLADPQLGADVSMILGVLHVYGDEGMEEKLAGYLPR
ncbi:MAG: hypothetical protein WBP12_03885 [Candidatus Saccharimonas sp.]